MLIDEFIHVLLFSPVYRILDAIIQWLEFILELSQIYRLLAVPIHV